MAEAEWLANTINSLMQRIEALEQRVAALELGEGRRKGEPVVRKKRLGVEKIEGPRAPSAPDKFTKALRQAFGGPSPRKKSVKKTKLKSTRAHKG